jgi:hypothetical protein
VEVRLNNYRASVRIGLRKAWARFEFACRIDSARALAKGSASPSLTEPLHQPEVCSRARVRRPKWSWLGKLRPFATPDRLFGFGIARLLNCHRLRSFQNARLDRVNVFVQKTNMLCLPILGGHFLKSVLALQFGRHVAPALKPLGEANRLEMRDWEDGKPLAGAPQVNSGSQFQNGPFPWNRNEFFFWTGFCYKPGFLR